VDEIPAFPVKFEKNPDGFQPYRRDPETLARPWAIPGTPGLEHRIGGIEKQETTGNVNYEPLNHEKMVRMRAAKVEAIRQDIPNVMPVGDPEGDLLVVSWGSTFGSVAGAVKVQREKGRKIGHLHLRHLNPLPGNLGDVLVIGWGGTYGSILTAVQRLQRKGHKVAHAHLRYLNPMPRNTGDVLKRYKKVLVPELNAGQLLLLLRARFAIDAVGLNKIQGKPFLVSEIEEKIEEMLR